MSNRCEVLLTLTGTANGEPVRQSVRAVMYEKEGKTFFHYPEPDPAMGSTRTTLKVEKDSIRIIRQGEFRMEQTFRPGSRTPGTYETPHGRMELDVHTVRLNNRLSRGIGCLEWAYELYVSGEHAGSYELRIETKAAPR